MVGALTCHDRPQYLRQTLESYASAIELCPEPFYLVISADDPDLETLALVRAYGDADALFVHEEQLGCAANTKEAVALGFAFAAVYEEDFVLALEDDLPLAPDALKLACWLRDTYRDDPDVICVGLKSVWATSPGDENLVRRTDWFGCHTWGTWRTEWERDFVPGWEDKVEGEPGYRGWDVTINDRIMDGRQQALPLLSRSQHIGERGTFANSRSYPPSIAPDWDISHDLTRVGGPYREREEKTVER